MVNNIFSKTRYKVQNRNGFDLSHSVSGTTKTGTLTPVMSRLLMPNSTVSLSANLRVELPPLATRPFGTISANLECFWVPCRILYKGWKKFITNQVETMGPSYDQVEANVVLPYVLSHKIHYYADDARGSLMDYLGFRSDNGEAQSGLKINILPVLAYGMIYNHWYRNSRIQNELFSDVDTSWGLSGFNPRTGSVVHRPINAYALPFRSVGLFEDTKLPFFPDGNGFSLQTLDANGQLVDVAIPHSSGDYDPDYWWRYADGTSIFALRQRNYSKDYFTNAYTTPQQTDNPAKVDFSGSSSFTIATLRAANSLQKYLEANNFSGEYDDLMKIHYGVEPSDSVLDKPLYLGRIRVPVYSTSVVQTSGDSNTTNNPYSSVGAKFGDASASSDLSRLCKKFTTTEFGYLFCIFSLVPSARYSTGVDRQLLYTSLGDFAVPELQSIGMQPIKHVELNVESALSDFAYTERYSDWKFALDTVHGELAPNGSLSSFVLDRSFAHDPELSTSFIQISTDALDEIFAVDTNIALYSCWYDIYFNFKVVMPLSAYSIPTLGDNPDTHTEVVDNGGKML